MPSLWHNLLQKLFNLSSTCICVCIHVYVVYISIISYCLILLLFLCMMCFLFFYYISLQVSFFLRQKNHHHFYYYYYCIKYRNTRRKQYTFITHVSYNNNIYSKIYILDTIDMSLNALTTTATNLLTVIIIQHF